MHVRYKKFEQMITKLSPEWIHKKVKTKDKNCNFPYFMLINSNHAKTWNTEKKKIILNQMREENYGDFSNKRKIYSLALK